jgi:8-oxo-dGTP diphosphatase
MACFVCQLKSGELVLKEHEAARWLSKEMLRSVEWLPADVEVLEKVEKKL